MPASAAITGCSRAISSAAVTLSAATLRAAAPSSMMSASAASRRACAIAASGARKRPPSENESAVILTMPTISGGIPLFRAVAFDHRSDRLRIGKDVELLDLDPDVADPPVAEAG